jgi:hypothetical protein
MKTDKERLIELLDSFGITPSANEGLGDLAQHVVTLRAGEGGIKGYRDFVADFEFNPDGSFKDVGVWE